MDTETRRGLMEEERQRNKKKSIKELENQEGKETFGMDVDDEVVKKNYSDRQFYIDGNSRWKAQDKGVFLTAKEKEFEKAWKTSKQKYRERRGNMYIAQLPSAEQEDIKRQLKAKGIKGEDLKRAMNSKLNDLEDIIW